MQHTKVNTYRGKKRPPVAWLMLLPDTGLRKALYLKSLGSSCQDSFTNKGSHSAVVTSEGQYKIVDFLDAA